MSFNCVFCEGNIGKLIYLNCDDYYLQKPFRVNYHQCEACGLTQQSPMPMDTSAFYDDYPIHQKKSWLFRKIQSIIMKPVYFSIDGITPQSKLLDYGCGDGGFLENSLAAHLDLIGFEPNISHSMHLSKNLGIPIFSDFPELVSNYEGKIDVITLHFVLEHLSDPHDIFQKLFRLLKPGGILFFTIPNLDSMEARLFGRKWHALDPPRHLTFLGEKHLLSMASKHGFELKKSLPLPFPNGFAGSLPVICSGRFRFILFLICLPLGVVFSRLFPHGTMGYWLVKM